MTVGTALKDLLVIDLSRVLAGPFCGQLLADMGANVIKVEPPNGKNSSGVVLLDRQGASRDIS
jgi:crotonobetainyl-CoA:carnitine CoA-transferase CaiB-like acyl-CoA transferase